MHTLPKTFIETALLFAIAPKDLLPIEQISWESIKIAHPNTAAFFVVVINISSSCSNSIIVIIIIII